MQYAEAQSSEARSRRQAQIVEAAREVFAEKGYEAAAMAEIARRVGVVEGAIYRHFGGKRDLLFEVLKGFYEAQIEPIRTALPGVRGAHSRLRFVIWSYLNGLTVDPPMSRLVIREIRAHADYEGSAFKDLNREVARIALQAIADGVEDGEVRTDVRPTMLRDLILGGIEHLAWDAVSGRSTLDIQMVADELTDLIWRGIAPIESATDPATSNPAWGDGVERLQAQVDRLERTLAALEARSSKGN